MYFDLQIITVNVSVYIYADRYYPPATEVQWILIFTLCFSVL